VNPFLGVTLHAVGGLAAASFYIPYKGVRRWSWESYWIVGGIFSWIIAPWTVALLTVPDVAGVLLAADLKTLFWCYFFGVLWGIGGLTFGLSVRYLGMSLGYAITLGFCAAFGTLIPPLFEGRMPELASHFSGWVVISGVGVCLAGIATCGHAGIRKERELSAEAKTASIQEFDFFKGVWVAVLSGVMSACMNYGITAGRPLAELAGNMGAPALFVNGPVFIIVLAGGFTTNVLWCVYLNRKNRSGGDYVNTDTPLLLNFALSALAGTTWYFQFMFFGMGKTQMGTFDFSSWTLHMAFIIIFSNIWGLIFREWRGSSRRTLHWVLAGILVLMASTIVVGTGNTLEERRNQDATAQETAATGEAAAAQPASLPLGENADQHGTVPGHTTGEIPVEGAQVLLPPEVADPS